MKKVLIVDDHPLVLAALTKVISYSFPDLGIIVAASAEEMRDVLERNRGKADTNHIVTAFVDLNLPDANGEDLLHELRVHHDIPVIILSSDASHDRILACLRNGASGFVEKKAGLAVFPAAMNAVLAGGQFFPSDLMIAKAPQARQEPAEYLTRRQMDVLDLLIAGKSNKAIAAKLGLAEGTVKNHVGVLLQAFAVESRSQLILATRKIGYRARSGKG